MKPIITEFDEETGKWEIVHSDETLDAMIDAIIGTPRESPPVDEDEDSDLPIGDGRLRRRPEGSPLYRDGGEEAS